MTTPLLFDLAPQSSLAVEHVCDMAVDLNAPQPIDTAVGFRLTYIAKDGRATGKISGEILAGGGDWVTVGTDGASRMDIRQTLRTDDGALIHYSALGIVSLPEDGRERIARGARIPFNEGYMRTFPKFETSDERYGWLTRHAFISVGELSPGHVDHRIYRVL